METIRDENGVVRPVDEHLVDNTNETRDGQHVNADGDTDAEKGAQIGGIGGAVTGAVAGSMVGPVGAIIGAVVGGIVGAAASGAAVEAIDKVDNDNTVSGVGNTVPSDPIVTAHNGGYNGNYADPVVPAVDTVNGTYGTVVPPIPGNGVPGIQTGGTNVDGSADTRGLMEKAADALTRDEIDDKTGKRVNGPAPIVDNGVPGVQTGGRLADGSPDTRGILEKGADAVTGDNVDDKTGKPVSR